MSFPRYPKYKDSGVEWLGEVPEHWEPRRLKSLIKEPLKYGANESAELDDRTQPRFIRITDINDAGGLRDETFKSLPAEVAADYLLREGDVLFARSGATVGKSFIYSDEWGPACFAGYLICARLQKSQCMPRWLYYFCQTSCYWGYVLGSQIQATIQNVSAEKYANLYLPIPPLTEQSAIAAFLDRETGKIDALVEEQRRLIELLKEKRQAVISHAVTKGLNPDVPMKPSGIDWLGDVPEHWEVFPLKRELVFLTSGSRGWAGNYADEGDLFLRIGNLTRDSLRLDFSDVQRVSVPMGIEGLRTRVSGGDVLFSVTAFLGAVAIVPDNLEPAYVSQHVALARLSRSRLEPRWVGYVTLSVAGRTWFDQQAYGGTKIQLSLDDVKNLLLLAPPIAEQLLIIEYLDEELERFDALTAEAERAIELLQERRTALISAAVTGKIDVRGLVAQAEAA